MADQNNPKTVAYPQEEDFSFSKLILERKQDVSYLWTFRKNIIISAAAGALIGALLAWYWPVTYTSRVTFVVEDSKAIGGSVLSGLAGQLGFDLGSMSGSNGVLAGDNVLQLLKSENMIRRTLVTPFPGKQNYSLADCYADSYKLKEKWAKYSPNKPITFPLNHLNYSRLQDSLLKVMITDISDKEVSVSKPDKKLSFFELNTTMRNEQLAQLFNSRLMEQATGFYILTKTKTQRNNVSRLQARADSIGRLLNKKTYSASAATDVLLDANPAYPTVNVNSELQERDKMLLETVWGETVKNLEVSRTMLAQETPAFQVVDDSILPLKKNRLGYLKGIALGSIGSSFIFCLCLLMIRKPDSVYR